MGENTRIRIKAAPGLIVKDPRTGRALPEGGLSVDFADRVWGSYWRKKWRQGEVVEVKSSKKKGD